MKTWFLIILFYLLVGGELFFDDTEIVIRYLHFSYLPYFVLTSFFFIYLIVFHRKKSHWFLPVFLFISYTFLTPLTSSLLATTKNTASTTVTSLKLLSFSVNSRNHNYQQVAQLIKQNPADIICLQEIPYSRYPLFIQVLNEEKLNYQHNYSKLASSMLLAKHPIIPNATVPYQKATLTIANQTLRIWNVHSPKSLQRKHYQGKFMRMLAKDVKADRAPHKLLCGDFNATPHNTLIHPFFNIMQPAFHVSNHLLSFTYPTNKTKLPTPIPFLKIDYFFLSATMKATHYQRLTKHANSDHYPITAQVEVHTTP